MQQFVLGCDVDDMEAQKVFERNKRVFYAVSNDDKGTLFRGIPSSFPTYDIFVHHCKKYREVFTPNLSDARLFNDKNAAQRIADELIDNYDKAIHHLTIDIDEIKQVISISSLMGKDKTKTEDKLHRYQERLKKLTETRPRKITVVRLETLCISIQ